MIFKKEDLILTEIHHFKGYAIFFGNYYPANAKSQFLSLISKKTWRKQDSYFSLIFIDISFDVLKKNVKEFLKTEDWELLYETQFISADFFSQEYGSFYLDHDGPFESISEDALLDERTRNRYYSIMNELEEDLRKAEEESRQIEQEKQAEKELEEQEQKADQIKQGKEEKFDQKSQPDPRWSENDNLKNYIIEDLD